MVYRVEQSLGSLIDWHTAISGNDYMEALLPNSDGTETVTITPVGPPSGAKFSRIAVSY